MKALISVFFIFLFALSVFTQTGGGGEVVVPKTFLRKSPKANAEVVVAIERGATVRLEATESKDGWYYVSVSGGKIKGWINQNTLRLTEATTATVNAASTETDNSVSSKTESSSGTANAERRKSSAAAQTENVETPVTARVPRTNETRTDQNSAATTKTENSTSAAVNPPAAASPSPAPTPNEEDEVVRIETEEVTLNVRVVDSGNRPVQNLKASEFTVYENNVSQPITSLTTAEVPISYALVVDNSRSLRSQLSKISEAGKTIVGTNRPADESTVVRFVSADKIEVVQDFTGDKRRLDEALDNLLIEGGQTAIIDAVYATAKRLEQHGQGRRKKDDPTRRALILITDGDERGSRATEQQLFDLLRASDVQIYAVGFTNELPTESALGGVNRQERARALLARLAKETGGKVYLPNSVEELSQIAADISAELRTQYQITYAPTNEKRDGSYRDIRVTVADGASREKRTAVTRAGRTSTAAAAAAAAVEEKKTKPNR